LRYRRIPYRFVIHGSREQQALPDRPLPLMPCLVFPGSDGEPTDAMSDTTPILNRLEVDFEGRSIRPKDPAFCFVDSWRATDGRRERILWARCKIERKKLK